MKELAVGILALAVMAGSAEATMSLSSAAFPASPASSSLFNAVGTFNFGNQKARLEAAGQTTVQGGNPANGWWGPNTGAGGAPRSWEVIWNNTSGTVTFNVYANSNYTSLAMTMTRTPTFAPGFTFAGLDIGVNLGGTAGRGFEYTGVEFDGGSGFVPVTTANASYSGVANVNNYFKLDGSLGDFTLRGGARFTSGTVASDGMRYFINARQAPIPEPGALGLLAPASLLLARRRRVD